MTSLNRNLSTFARGALLLLLAIGSDGFLTLPVHRHLPATPKVCKELKNVQLSQPAWPRAAASYTLDPTAAGGGEMTISSAGQGAAASDAGGYGSRNALEMLMETVTSLEAKKLYVWVGFLGLAWKMKTFYGLILGTFVLSYIGSTLVRWLERRGNQLLTYVNLPRLPRRLWAGAYIAAVLALVSTLTVYSVPRVVGETNYLSLVIESENPYVFVADGIRELLGPEAMSNLEAFLLTVTGEEGRNFASGVIAAQGAASVQPAPGKVMRMMPAVDQVWTAQRASRFAKVRPPESQSSHS